MVYENAASYIGVVFQRCVHFEYIVLCLTVVLYYFLKFMWIPTACYETGCVAEVRTLFTAAT